MAFVDTVDSLYNYFGNAAKEMLGKSLEKSINVSSSNDTFTINPNISSMFTITVTANSNITLSSLNSPYTTTGSVVSILMNMNSDNLVISWPTYIKWQEEVAPDLSHNNLVTLINFGENNVWYGGAINIDDDYPSNS